jgi:putative ABC transport system ATP-binding protein
MMAKQSERALITMDGIAKVFQADDVETHALLDVHLEIAKGDFLSIEGPSGSGKSTLLSIMGLLDEPTGGTYRLGGQVVTAMSPVERAYFRNEQIGFVFQSFNLIGDLSIYENVELPLRYRKMPARDVRTAVETALERVGMTHRKNHMPSQLSGGQQQRVAVARAVVGNPSLVLADEPTGNLDSKNGEAVMGLLRELHLAGATICMVTHNHEYTRYATRAVELHDGRLSAEERVAVA